MSGRTRSLGWLAGQAAVQLCILLLEDGTHFGRVGRRMPPEWCAFIDRLPWWSLLPCRRTLHCRWWRR